MRLAAAYWSLRWFFGPHQSSVACFDASSGTNTRYVVPSIDSSGLKVPCRSIRCPSMVLAGRLLTGDRPGRIRAGYSRQAVGVVGECTGGACRTYSIGKFPGNVASGWHRVRLTHGRRSCFPRTMSSRTISVWVNVGRSYQFLIYDAEVGGGQR